MKIVDEHPTEGQFIAVWEYDGVIWSEVRRWNNGKLEAYYDPIYEEEPWRGTDPSINQLPEKYIVKD
ncbi:hypothetical protein KAR91_62285 [Candidatus Pacearchaeota archaeon]|nr:hypothetical protein [Candidatus Pacearchaeota archaeon]